MESDIGNKKKLDLVLLGAISNYGINGNGSEGKIALFVFQALRKLDIIELSMLFSQNFERT
jgi:hypothetical protein